MAFKRTQSTERAAFDKAKRSFTGAPDSNTSSFSHVSLDFVYENDDDEPNAPKAEPQLRLQCASLRAERPIAQRLPKVACVCVCVFPTLAQKIPKLSAFWQEEEEDEEEEDVWARF